MEVIILSKEIFLGTIPAILIFLIFLGVGITPIFILGLLSIPIYFVIKNKSINFNKQDYKFMKHNSDIRFEQIGGQDRAISEIKESLEFLLYKDKIEQYGIRPIKGILLTGPPGTGKTLLAKAAANYTSSVFIATAGSQFTEMYVGVGAARIRDLFLEAKNKALKEGKETAIIFIDEIDTIGAKRGNQQQREYDQTLNQLLIEMDGISNNDKVRIIVIAATNRKDILDSALLRPGRFDRHIQVDLPDKQGRKKILEIHLKNKPLADNINIEDLAYETYGFSGAQLESVANEAAIYAMREDSKVIEKKHFTMSIEKILLGEHIDKQTSFEEKRRVAYHELGHAIVSEVVTPFSVSNITLKSRGQALGYVRQNSQDQSLYTKKEIEAKIMVALAGAAAEEVWYNEKSTGAKGDYEQALNLAKLIIDTGLSPIGIIDISLISKKEINETMRKIINDLYNQTKNIVIEYKEFIEQVFEIIIKDENLDGETFRLMLEKFQNKSEYKKDYVAI